MKKGQKPGRHTRCVKTKRGRKRVVVNRHIPRKKKPHGLITVEERKIFNHISNPDEFSNEMGGAIDFDKKGRIENINVVPGGEFDVYLPTDYEVQYHTHPDHYMSPPTPDDILAIVYNNKQQAEIVFQDGKAFVIVKTPESKKLSSLSEPVLKKKLDAIFMRAGGPNWEQNWKKDLENLGFFVYIDKNKTKPLSVDIRPKEPKNKPKRVKHKWA